MIEKITTNKNGDKLTVEVTCKIRKFAIHAIKELTTEQVIDKISEEYTIKEILQVPKKTIGNTNRKKMSNFGTWIFKIKEDTNAEKPKTKRTRKPRQSKEPEKSPTSSSIRGRMSKLANKKD